MDVLQNYYDNEFFPAKHIRLRFRLAVFFSADFRRTEIRRLIRISAAAGAVSAIEAAR